MRNIGGGVVILLIMAAVVGLCGFTVFQILRTEPEGGTPISLVIVGTIAAYTVIFALIPAAFGRKPKPAGPAAIPRPRDHAEQSGPY